ncbi:MAG: ABC transporter ATP-binding protein [Pseudomonadales bacterium]|jgi:iron(III) transport system ATP-binding protein|nr:ABC transporter ATP-binding protein [Pseudomonadales bacterium]
MSHWLRIDGISCRYGNKEVLRDLSFEVQQGHIACLLGTSGCGKTTALRAIAGLEPIQSGSIQLAGATLSTPAHSLPPERRQVGMVFQDYALFPHLNVRANIVFGLHGLSKNEQRERSEQLLALIRMQEYAEVYPHQLSGGQQQRVALARALAPRPKLLLLDEPFSNLDTELRQALSLEVRDILRQHHTTAILVTHDQNEAFAMSDVIGVMAQGRLLQWAGPRQLFYEPASPEVAAFVSQGQFLGARLLSPTRIETPLGEVELDTAHPLWYAEQRPVQVLLRPWNLHYSPAGGHLARLQSQEFSGAYTLSSLRLDNGLTLTSNDDALAALPLGSTVGLSLSARHLRLFLA